MISENNSSASVTDPLRLDGRPGFRAPHVRIVANGTEKSTVDLWRDGWVLLTGTAGGVWHSAARHLAEELGVALTAFGLGPDLTDPDGNLVERFGIGHAGASLIRPDGIVAWRTGTEPIDPTGTLRAAPRRVLALAR